MRYLSVFLPLLFLLITGCTNPGKPFAADERQAIAQCVDRWHQAAADADLQTYFGCMTKDAVFIGTDATERWTHDSFMAFCRPYFERGKAWSFTSLQRHIMFDRTQHIAWMDELLRTQMKLCRGSAVLCKENNTWKIAHYVLSMTIPNELTRTVVPLKTPIEDSVMDAMHSANSK